MWTVLFGSTAYLHAAEQARFKWALLYDTQEGMRAVDFNNPPVFKAHTTLQFFFHPDKTTYLYLLLLDSSRVFSPVFPVAMDYYDNFPPGEPMRIPGGNGRFTILPPAGEESFYLLASPLRLTTIEELMEYCMLHPEDINRQAELFREVRLLRRKHSRLIQFTEKGVPISGTMSNLAKSRGGQEVGETFAASEVEAGGFYSRIIRIEHD